MTKRFKDSLILSFAVVTGMATVFTVIGFSMKDLCPLKCVQPEYLAIFLRAIILLFIYAVITWLIWLIKGKRYGQSITLKIGKNEVTIKPGNIFDEDAWRVIGMDTHFDTNADDSVISETSLHGQLVLKHGDAESIKAAVKKEADRRKIKPDSDGKYTFRPGTSIPYKGKDGNYIMVALTDLNSDYEAHTRMPQFESTLMTMCRIPKVSYKKVPWLLRKHFIKTSLLTKKSNDSLAQLGT